MHQNMASLRHAWTRAQAATQYGFSNFYSLMVKANQSNILPSANKTILYFAPTDTVRRSVKAVDGD